MMVKRMRSLEITNMEARNLNNVQYFGKMDVYGVVSVEGNPQVKQTTPVVKKGGTNPAWNFSMTFTIDVDEAKKKGINLLFQFKSKHKFPTDKHIGEVKIPIRELLDTFNNGKQPIQHLRHRALTTSATPSSRIKTGELNFSYKFYKTNKGPANSKPPPATGMLGYQNPPPTPERKSGFAIHKTIVVGFLSALAGSAGYNMVKRMRTLEVTNMEARNLNNVRHFFKMDVYGVVSVEGDPQVKQTPVVKNGGTNPAWNFSMTFTIDVDEAKKKGLNLLFQLKSKHKVHTNKHIGEVKIPIRELLDTFDNGKQPIQHLRHRALTTLATPSSRIKTGELNFSYKFYKINKGSANSKPPPATGMPGYENPPPTPEGKLGSTILRTVAVGFLSALASAAGSNVGTEAFS